MATTLLIQGAAEPILQKMKGTVSKIRAGPTPGSIPAAKTAGMTAKPAIRAKRRSKTVVPTPETSMFSLGLMYEEYVRTVPTPSEREKKLCPRAEARALGVSRLKSGLSR